MCGSARGCPINMSTPVDHINMHVYDKYQFSYLEIGSTDLVGVHFKQVGL